MNAFTEGGTPVRLGEEMGRGGEAIVYHVAGKTSELAKIYTRSGTGYHAKVRFMRSSPPDDPTRGIGHASIAWPRELLLDRKRRFVGYLMPHIRDGVPLVSVFNPRRRAQVLPGFSRAYLYRAARNLASAMAALHARGYVVGDVNERNVLVTPRALVTLIDTDSFQVQQPTDSQIVVYPCPVGRLEYTPPELQGRAFQGVLRLAEHDRFGLAVLLFQLLMNGSHPFRGIWLAGGDPPPVEVRISQGWYPYSSERPTQIAPPPGAAPLSVLHPDVAALFDRCFEDGHGNPGLRPTAEEWARFLSAAEGELASCPSGHAYPKHLDRCPDCGARRSRLRRSQPSGPEPVPDPPGVHTGGTVTVGGGTAAVRPAGWSPTSGLSQAWAAVVAPLVGLRQGASGLSRSLDAAVNAVQAVPRKALLGTLGQARQPRALAISLERGQRMIAWTSFLAIAAAVAGLAIAFTAALLGPMLAVNETVSAGLTPATRAFASAAAALVVIGMLRRLSESAKGKMTGKAVRSAAGRAAAGVAGWTAGWIAIGAVFYLATPTSLSAVALGPPTADALAGSGGWTLGWAIYGASAGALGAAIGDRPLSWAVVGAVFGAAGWAALQVVAAAWSLTV